VKEESALYLEKARWHLAIAGMIAAANTGPASGFANSTIAATGRKPTLATVTISSDFEGQADSEHN
jgi:hypothetical protein